AAGRGAVRHVTYVRGDHEPAHVLPLEPQAPPDQVAEHEGPHVAEVGVAVDSRAAGVHPHGATVGRLDLLDVPVERVVETHDGEDTAERSPDHASRLGYDSTNGRGSGLRPA